MADRVVQLRKRADIKKVEHLGYRCRQYFAGGGEVDGVPQEIFGALRVFDDVVIKPRSNLLLESHDGFEVLIYVLEGLCLLEDDRGEERMIAPGGAAHLVLGRGIRHDLSNRSSTEPLHLLMAAVVATTANPRPRSTLAGFERAKRGVVWVASFDSKEHDAGALLTGASVRLGIAKLDSGVEVRFPRAIKRGLYVNLLEGKIELESAVVDEGGDARVSLDAPVCLRAMGRAHVVVVDVAMGPSQRLW